MKRKYSVAVILVNYNSGDYTLDCVKSIQEQTAKALPIQIIIIDNNSRMEEYKKIESLRGIDNIQLFRSRINTGFSGANMMGVQLADADYYYFLNNDCVLMNDCISLLYDFSEKNATVGSCSGEMYNGDGLYEAGFGYFPTIALKLWGSGLLRFFAPKRYPKRSEKLSKPTSVDFVSGSSMFMRAISFERMGGFDINYFLYCEEEDIALRLKRNGFSTYIFPEAKFQHFMNKSTESSNSIKLPFLKEFYISFLYFYRKNYNPFYRFIIQVLSFYKAIRKFYRDRNYVVLAFFIARGAPAKFSLRFDQKISEKA